MLETRTATDACARAGGNETPARVLDSICDVPARIRALRPSLRDKAIRHAELVRRNRLLLDFIEQRVKAGTPTWRAIVIAAKKAGLCPKGWNNGDFEITLMRVWRKRRYWLSEKAFTQYQSGAFR
jgi:hypothetical protein